MRCFWSQTSLTRSNLRGVALCRPSLRARNLAYLISVGSAPPAEPRFAYCTSPQRFPRRFLLLDWLGFTKLHQQPPRKSFFLRYKRWSPHYKTRSRFLSFDNLYPELLAPSLNSQLVQISLCTRVHLSSFPCYSLFLYLCLFLLTPEPMAWV